MARRPDDYSLSVSQQRLIRSYAERSLREADALGRFPTPVGDVLESAGVVVADEDVLDDRFLAKMRKKAGKALRIAIKKVLGVLDAAARIIYLDKSVLLVRQTFLKLHETAHAVLPWQRDIYVVAEDCEMTIAPEIAESFEREANAFACEVIFQLDAFTVEANDHDFGILVPVRLSKRYGASIYASVRRYVTQNSRACMVLVLELPEACPRRGFVCKLRRDVVSLEFRNVVGPLDWPDKFCPDDEVGALVPIGGRKMSRPREIVLVGRDGRRHVCIAESFTQSRHVFVLIHTVATLTRGTVRMH